MHSFRGTYTLKFFVTMATSAAGSVVRPHVERPADYRRLIPAVLQRPLPIRNLLFAVLSALSANQHLAHWSSYGEAKTMDPLKLPLTTISTPILRGGMGPETGQQAPTTPPKWAGGPPESV